MLSRLILTLILLFTCALEAEIIEAPHFKDILKYVDGDTFVILDIDDTLLVPKQTLGTDVWFLYRLKQYQATMPPKEALNKALEEWEAIRHLTEVKIVEEGTEKVVEQLQKQAPYVMALTTQELVLATCTTNQLKSLGMDMSIKAPAQEDQYFMNGQGVLYRGGILFTSGTAKGKALLTLLEMIKIAPKKIVFINDKRTHLADVEGAVEAKGIKFTGLRYSIGDERIKNFNPEIADIQWRKSSFGHILSDEEAAKLLCPAIP